MVSWAALFFHPEEVLAALEKYGLSIWMDSFPNLGTEWRAVGGCGDDQSRLTGILKAWSSSWSEG